MRMTCDDILAKLEAVDVPAGPINTLDEVFNDPQVIHRGAQAQPAGAPPRPARFPASARRS